MRVGAELWRQRHIVVAPLLAAVTAVGLPGLVRLTPGDTLWGLAREHHTSVAAIAQANGLSGDRIYAGRLLRLPGPTAARSTPAATPPATAIDRPYRVLPGDCLSLIAQRFGISEAAIAARNHLRDPGLIIGGSTLLLPGRTAGPDAASVRTPAPAGYSTRTTQAAARSRAVLAARPPTSKAYVEQVIHRTAVRLRVDPSLALAVGYQESGFQQHVVSPANAIGAMQVLPSTGAWLSSDVVGRHLDLFEPNDNALAGVTLLHQLLRTESPSGAVAAYYQGLGSIHQHGRYASTNAYVSNVLRLKARFH